MKTGKWTLLTIFGLAVGISLIVLPTVLAWDFHGRMTGGGSVCKPSGCVDVVGDTDGRVTHGFELHCAPEDVPNRLEINDHSSGGDGHRFHLESLDDTFCYTDPAIDSKPPAAGFNTYVGRGNGRYDGVSGFCANWTFTDAGEPGDHDTMAVRITDTPGVPGDDDNAVIACTGNVLLDIKATLLTYGNHQAHKNP